MQIDGGTRASGSVQTGFEFWFCHSPAVWSWTFLVLPSLLCPQQASLIMQSLFLIEHLMDAVPRAGIANQSGTPFLTEHLTKP